MDPTLLRQTANKWREGCEPYAPAALYPQVSFLRLLVLSSVRGWVDSRTIVRPEGLGKLEKNPPHRDANSWPSGLQHSALTTTLLRAPSNSSQGLNSLHYTALHCINWTRSVELYSLGVDHIGKTTSNSTFIVVLGPMPNSDRCLVVFSRSLPSNGSTCYNIFIVRLKSSKNFLKDIQTSSYSTKINHLPTLLRFSPPQYWAPHLH
jgi:hypothetical protein